MSVDNCSHSLLTLCTSAHPARPGQTRCTGCTDQDICSTPTTYTTTYALVRVLSFFSKLCQLNFCYYPLIKAAEVLHSECKWFSFDKGFVTLNLKDDFQQETPLVSKLKGTLSQHQLILRTYLALQRRHEVGRLCWREKLLSWSGGFPAGSGMRKGGGSLDASFWLLAITPMTSLSQALICWLGWKYWHSSHDLETLSLSASFLTWWPLQSLTRQRLSCDQ